MAPESECRVNLHAAEGSSRVRGNKSTVSDDRIDARKHTDDGVWNETADAPCGTLKTLNSAADGHDPHQPIQLALMFGTRKMEWCSSQYYAHLNSILIIYLFKINIVHEVHKKEKKK